jgi:hypothetical protein
MCYYLTNCKRSMKTIIYSKNNPHLLNYGAQVQDDPKLIVERYPFPYGVVGGLISAAKSSLYLTEQN